MGIVIEPDIQIDSTPQSNDITLWLTVMDRAVRDLVALERFRQDPSVLEDPVFVYDYRTLKEWFRSSSMEPGSFQWICSLVAIDPMWALQKLEKHTKTKLSGRAKGRGRVQLFSTLRVKAA